MATWPVLAMHAIELRRADAYGPLQGDEIVPVYSPLGHGRSREGSIPLSQLGGGGGGPGGTFKYNDDAFPWPIADRLREKVYLLDFIPEEWHEKIRLRTTNINTIPDENTFDCSPAIEAAMAAFSSPIAGNVYMIGPEIIFPVGRCCFSRTIEMKKTMIFTGNELGGRNAFPSELFFAKGITGITVNSLNGYKGSLVPPYWPVVANDPNMTQGGDASTLRGLRLASASGGVYDPAVDYSGFTINHGVGHGIWTRAHCNIHQCTTQFFPGHGLYVRAVAQGSVSASDNSDAANLARSFFGNANLMYVENFNSLSNGGCGVYIDGPDTNAGTFILVDAGSNKLSGIYDSSLIGNTHMGHHTDNNGNAGFCSYALNPEISPNVGIRYELGKYGARYSVLSEGLANGICNKWLPLTHYDVGDLVSSASFLYLCSQAGISSATGEPGKTSNWATNVIPDGTCIWGIRWDADKWPMDVVPRIPPAGHPDSELAWNWNQNSPSVPDGGVYAPFPYEIDGVTLRKYRRGHPYWFNQASAYDSVLINPYEEGGQAPSYMTASTLVLGQLNSSFSNTTRMGGTGGMGGSFEINSVPNAAFPDHKKFQTRINMRDDESLTWVADGDNINGLSFMFSDVDKTWSYGWNRGANALKFTTEESTIAGGRTGPLVPGNVMFANNGIWLGKATIYARQHSTEPSIPISGEYAVGDVIYNATPGGATAATTGFTSPMGWMCTMTGAVASLLWAPDKTYKAGDLVKVGTSPNSYVCVTPGVSHPTLSWVSDTLYTAGQLRLNGGNVYSCVQDGRSMYSSAQAPSKAWAPSQSQTPVGLIRSANGQNYKLLKVGTSGSYAAWVGSTSYAIGASVTNGGRFYVCQRAGISAATGGPTGTDPINFVTDGTVRWVYQAVQGPYTTVANGVQAGIFDGTAKWRWIPTSPLTGPSGTADGIVDGSVIWNYVNPSVGTDSVHWANNTMYRLQQTVVNAAHDIFRNEIAGASASNVPWEPSTVYKVGDMRANVGNSYRVFSISGDATSASSGGPTGTQVTPVVDIIDNNVVWRYQSDIDGPNGATPNQLDGQCRWSQIVETADGGTGPTGTGGYIVDGSCVWAYKLPMVMTPFDAKLSQQTIASATGSGAAFTVTPGTSSRNILYAGVALTADKTVSLSSTGALAGMTFRITRTAQGAFFLNFVPIGWAANLVYSLGIDRYNLGNVYKVVTPGLTATNTLWAANTVYKVGDTRKNDTNHCYVVEAVIGDAKSGGLPGPSGTSPAAIIDGNVTWTYQSVTGGPTGTGTAIQDGTVTWKFVAASYKALGASEWCEVTHDGLVWYCSASGAL